MNKKQILPSRQIDSSESEPKSPPSKRQRLAYKEKSYSNKRVTIQCVNCCRYRVIYCTLNNLRTIFTNIYLLLLNAR